MAECNDVEQWLPIPGWEGLYDVSDHGRVRSLDRTVLRGGHPMKCRGRILSPNRDIDGYLLISLHRAGKESKKKIHRLVLEAFVSPCPDGMECLHDDGNVANNRLTNLRWGTPSENAYDKKRHGTDHHLNNTCCPHGHRLEPPNLVKSKERLGYRGCLTCKITQGKIAHAFRHGRTLDYQVTADECYSRVMSGNGPVSWNEKTHCPRGHLLKAPNLVASKLAVGHRKCLACDRAHAEGQHAIRAGRCFDRQEASDRHYGRILAGTDGKRGRPSKTRLPSG